MNIITSVILFAVLMLSCALQACNPTPAAVPNDTHSKSVCEYEHLQNLLFKDAARFSASRANPSLQDAIFSRWSASGSEWDLRELFGFEKNYSDKYRFGHRGDYDFTATSLISILMLFGSNPERLRPETARHIAEVLLVDKGGKPRQTVPGSLGLVEETENHILMTESSRYLANQWLHRHYSPIPQYDNRTNGLEDWLINYLAGIRRLGFHEYNSIPYQGYTIHALLNLEAFADSDRVRSLSRISLDNICRLFALSSLNSDFLIRAENKMAHFGGLYQFINHPRICFRVAEIALS